MQVQPTAQGARNFSQCDSMLIGDNAGANTYPYIQVGLSTKTWLRADTVTIQKAALAAHCHDRLLV